VTGDGAAAAREKKAVVIGPPVTISRSGQRAEIFPGGRVTTRDTCRSPR
jgi:hypothetical protein